MDTQDTRNPPDRRTADAPTPKDGRRREGGRLGTILLIAVIVIAVALYFYYFMFSSSLGLGGR